MVVILQRSYAVETFHHFGSLAQLMGDNKLIAFLGEGFSVLV
jgi:hypothetical protein